MAIGSGDVVTILTLVVVAINAVIGYLTKKDASGIGPAKQEIQHIGEHVAEVQQKVYELHVLTDGRTQQLMDQSAKTAHAEGYIEGIRASPDTPPEETKPDEHPPPTT